MAASPDPGPCHGHPTGVNLGALAFAVALAFLVWLLVPAPHAVTTPPAPETVLTDPAGCDDLCRAVRLLRRLDARALTAQQRDAVEAVDEAVDQVLGGGESPPGPAHSPPPGPPPTATVPATVPSTVPPPTTRVLPVPQASDVADRVLDSLHPPGSPVSVPVPEGVGDGP